MAVEAVVGVHAVRAVLLQSPARVLELWLAERSDERRGRGDGGERAELEKLAQDAGIAMRRVPRRTIERHADNARHQGVLARCRPSRRQQVSLEDLVSEHGPQLLVVAVDGVEDPHNLGAIVRAAACFGAHAVVRSRSRGAPLGPGAMKSAAGGDLLVPLVEVPNLARALDMLADAAVNVVGAAGEGEPLSEVSLARPLALVLGAEHDGLRRLTREKCTALAAIPMPGLAGGDSPLDSLNVALSAGVLLYEATRRA